MTDSCRDSDPFSSLLSRGLCLCLCCVCAETQSVSRVSPNPVSVRRCWGDRLFLQAPINIRIKAENLLMYFYQELVFSWQNLLCLIYLFIYLMFYFILLFWFICFRHVTSAALLIGSQLSMHLRWMWTLKVISLQTLLTSFVKKCVSEHKSRAAALVIVLLCFSVTEAVTVQSFRRFVIILKLVIMPTICSTFRGEMQLSSSFCWWCLIRRALEPVQRETLQDWRLSGALDRNSAGMPLFLHRWWGT